MSNQYVSVLDIKFCVCDEEGNELRNADGSIKEFYCWGELKPLEHLCDDMTIEDLEEVNDEN